MEDTAKKRKFALKTRDITNMASFVAILCVCSWINITVIPPVPFTLQTFAVFACLLFLGGFKGSIVILIYLALGAIGVPVFTNFKSGITALIGPTGGYLFGFFFMGLFYWAFEAIFKNKKYWIWFKIIVLVLATILLYAIGTLFFVLIYTNAGKPTTLYATLMACVIPFIPADLAKLALALLLYNRLKRFVK